MLTYYQPFLLPFLHSTPYRVAAGVARRYFLSFEDALWTLLEAKNIPKGSVILIPDFYCIDVVDNIRNHGHQPALYPLDEHFQITKKRLSTYIKRYRPQVVILFHACGITSHILGDSRYMQKLCRHQIVIEDAVHRLVNPQNIRILHENHFLMDSLRKVSPLPGSFIYGTPNALTFRPKILPKELLYFGGSFLLYLLFRAYFSFGVIMKSASIISYSHKKILKTHDDIVGDSVLGYPGWWHDFILHHFINFTKIEKIKLRQVNLYNKALKPVFKKQTDWYAIRIPTGDKKLLHVYPVGLRGNRTEQQLQKIEQFFLQHNAPIWFKYTDSPWSTHNAALFLPLGFHVTDQDIQKACTLLLSSDIKG